MGRILGRILDHIASHEMAYGIAIIALLAIGSVTVHMLALL
jgi:hypothetical protein